MNRLSHSSSNLPPYMRKRVRKYGTYYYLDTGAKPRVEIPLGSDYIAALRRYAELQAPPSIQQHRTFADAINRYRVQELPNKSPNTIRVLSTDLKYLEDYFGDAPMDEIRPMHIRMFLDKHRDKPTTANRCKRVFSAIWNVARGWGYIDSPTPSIGIKGYNLHKRDVYVSDQIYEMVWSAGTTDLRNAMDLAYLTGQRPSDALRMSTDDIEEGYLVVNQGKTGKRLRIVIAGELASLLDRITALKIQYHSTCHRLLINKNGGALTPQTLRNLFKKAKLSAIEKNPAKQMAIKDFWFYDLRAKAADDVGDRRGAQEATDLLGHDSPSTTNRHYRRRGKIVMPTK